MAADSHDGFHPGQVLAGKLKVVRRLGSGGMGAVYEVEHLLTRHRRALKVLHTEVAQRAGMFERFLREASAAGRIQSPHIVETFDVGHLEGSEPYHLMELLDGTTLSLLIEKEGPLSLERACAIVAQACRGTHAAHRAGIVHRDLKPDNLFLTGPDQDFVKILDFGISKFDPTTTDVVRLTIDGSPMGTPYYMSPEQVRGELLLDARTDIWALGVVLYECLTGRPPFLASTLPQLAVLIHEGRYAPVTELRPELPAQIDRVLSRAIATQPTQRFASAAELEAALVELNRALPVGPLEVTAPGAAALDVTARGALELAATSGVPAPSELAATSGAPESRESAERRRHRLPFGVTVAGLCVLALVVVGSAFLVGSPERPEPAAASAVPVPAAVASPVASSSGVIRAEPIAQPPPMPDAAAAEPPQPVRPSTARSAAPPRSRAREHGLAEDNPFR